MSSHARLVRRAVPLVALLAAGVVTSVACSKTEEPGGVNANAGGSGDTAGGAGGTSSTAGGTAGTTGGSTSTAGGSSADGGASAAGGTASGGSGNGGSAGGGGAGPIVCDASSAPAISKLGVETVVQSNDFRVLVYAAQAPGSDDWYLVDALGQVRVFSGGALQPTPFLDLGSEVMGSDFGDKAPAGGSQDYDERGLLSIAFPPDYATSGKFYVALVPTSGSAIDHDLVLEFTRSAGNPLVADPASRKVIFELEEGGVGYQQQGFSYAKYHNGSTLVFGPDGMLYFGFGDGGGDCNAARPGAPQDVSSPYGKILRLDPKQPGPLYAAADNPFPEGDARVFHYGVRNPFRFSFDSATGDLYIGEVGQWSHDSIAFAPAGSKGLNFGWPAFEGTAQNPTQQCASNTPLRSGSTRTNPIFNLAHGSSGGVANLIVAIVGGSVYRGSAIPELYGAYLFGEYYPNRPMRALYQCGEQTSEVTTIQKRCDPNLPNAACFTPVNGAPELSQVAAIVEGHDKELYIPANGNTLLKIVPAP